jgi:N6-L-threonylcarbamoyladenine synthase
MLVLGLETSCDETGVAIVDDGGRILSHALLSQTEAHRLYGGVVPEIAARAHLDHIDALVAEAIRAAGVTLNDLSGIAATCGPGLIGGVMVGTMMGKALALASGKPFIAINHLEAHALTVRLGAAVEFPYLLLLISGGHCQVMAVEGVGKYKLYGRTIDDAVGEAFDKTAKLLGLGFPGGPAVEKAAANGDPKKYPLPQPLLGKPGCDFSFSGLKTAVRQATAREAPLDDQKRADLAASFQRVVAACLADRVGRAMTLFKKDHPGGTALVAAGGVAANAALRSALELTARQGGLQLVVPPPALCTDNGVMIAWAGIEKLRLGLTDTLDFAPRPRWPLEEMRPNNEVSV